jgi:hypothetical protein
VLLECDSQGLPIVQWSMASVSALMVVSSSFNSFTRDVWPLKVVLVVVGGCSSVFQRVPADLRCLNGFFFFLSPAMSVMIPIIVAAGTSASQGCLWRGCFSFVLRRLKLVTLASYEFLAALCGDCGNSYMY